MGIRARFTALLLLALIAHSTPAASAQEASQTAVQASEIEVVIVSLVRELSFPLANAIVGGERLPVEIEIPDSTSEWRQARDRLMTVLAGRLRTDSDTRYLRVRVGPISIRGDTLLASHAVDWMEYCPFPRGEPRGWLLTGSSHEIRSIRAHGTWPRATTLREGHTDGWCVTEPGGGERGEN